jgi:hypothetical protein
MVTLVVIAVAVGVAFGIVVMTLVVRPAVWVYAVPVRFPSAS